MRGEPGVGKTELLEYLAARAAGFRIAHATGVECELELPFAGLHVLSARMPDRIERRPMPKPDALLTALGLMLDSVPDPFLVGWPYSDCWRCCA